VEVHLDDKTLKEWQRKEERIINTSSTLDTARILYEDSEILVYNKPAGLIVHSPDHKANEVSLIEQIEVYLLSKGWKPSGTFDHPALAHRIDRETSGIIIACLTRKSYEHMAEQFRTRKVKKTYHALVSGKPHPESGIIKAPILRLNTGKTDEAKMVIDNTGDSAETEYRVIGSSEVFGLAK
jgi:23S rRNA pseudouridine1911/1915/1917 synthase